MTMPTLDDYIHERVNILVHPDHSAAILVGTIPAETIGGPHANIVLARAYATSWLAHLLGFPAGEPLPDALSAANAMDYVTNTDTVLARYNVTWEEASNAGTWLMCRRVPEHQVIDDDATIRDRAIAGYVEAVPLVLEDPGTTNSPEQDAHINALFDSWRTPPISERLI